MGSCISWPPGGTRTTGCGRPRSARATSSRASGSCLANAAMRRLPFQEQPQRGKNGRIRPVQADRQVPPDRRRDGGARRCPVPAMTATRCVGEIDMSACSSSRRSCMCEKRFEHAGYVVNVIQRWPAPPFPGGGSRWCRFAGQRFQPLRHDSSVVPRNSSATPPTNAVTETNTAAMINQCVVMGAFTCRSG